jgi:hypothetical protein
LELIIYFGLQHPWPLSGWDWEANGLKLKHLQPLIVIACYGTAAIGSIAAAVTLLMLS